MNTEVQHKPMPGLKASDELHFLRYCYQHMSDHIDDLNGGGTDAFLAINIDNLHSDYVNETGHRVPNDYA